MEKKKRGAGVFHVQERIGPKRFFLGEGGKRVQIHREALSFLTPQDAGLYIQKNGPNPLWEIAVCDCPKSEW